MRAVIDREKEIKLLHLDNLQREILAGIIAKFINHKEVSVKEAVEAFVSYLTKLVELSAAGATELCDDDGNIIKASEDHLQQFCQGLYLCSKYNINYSKILRSSGVKCLLVKATAPRTRSTTQNIYELEYKIKILAYGMLEKSKSLIEGHVAVTEEIYMSNLAKMNPLLMKHAFIEHIVDIIADNNNQTLGDIAILASKYAKHLDIDNFSERYIEELIQRYSNIESMRNIGAIQVARVSVYKEILGGSESERRKYAAYQLINYVHEQANNKFVMGDVMQNLKIGVESICLAAFGEENYGIVREESERILRSILETKQLGFGGKIMKLLDYALPLPGNSILTDLLDSVIKSNHERDIQKTEVIKSSWADEIKIER